MSIRISKLLASAMMFIIASVAIVYADTIHYHNLKYGTEITFPTHLFQNRLDAPPDGSGMVWEGKNGSSISVYTVANALVLSLPEFAKMAAQQYQARAVKVTTAINENIVALSGNDNGQVFHMRYLFDSDDIIHGIIVKYPAGNKALYEEYLPDMLNSLRVVLPE